MIEGYAIYRNDKFLLFLGYGSAFGAEKFRQDLGLAEPKAHYSLKKARISVSIIEEEPS